MLKAIELAGFKSFADRTRMEFEGGISALVGPNGSGKSNIVDAIKWVLGEQSMKKLRSTESTDVIFSGSSERAPLGSAEVTLTFDNATKKIFNLETPEVHITRRVYRSGEGEYLINRQASRLKDIKDLLSGTGLGTQAYSIIEQGRVESLLQSSPIQRRVIFEEAAGIGFYNSRKLEAQRRLERVEQNLVRAGDIVSGLDNQLRTARSQAGKAQLYRQYSARLRELRIRTGLIDSRRHRELRSELEREVEQLGLAVDELTATVEENERQVAEVNTEIEDFDREILRFEGEIAATRQRIAGEESTIELQTTQIEEIDVEIAHNARQLLELNVRSGDIEEMMRKTTDDVRKAKRTTSELDQAYRTLQEQGEQLSTLRKEKQEAKDSLHREIDTKNKQTAKLAGTISGLESKLTTIQGTRQQALGKRDRQEEKERELVTECDRHREIVENLEELVRQKQEQLEAAKQRKSKRARQLAKLVAELSELKQKQSGMREKISVLEDLIRKNDGLSPGVKEVLQQSRNPKSPFHDHVFGLVADLLRVDVESAALIEAALGANAQHVVISPKAEVFRHIQENAVRFAGRVGFTWIAEPKEDALRRIPDFEGRPGVHGRADAFVRTDKKFARLAKQLLGRTWVVENFGIAVQLFVESGGQASFLTVAGELLDQNGALIVGPQNASSGIITRRSELRTLGDEMKKLDAQVAKLEIDVAAAQERVAGDEIDVEEENREYQKSVKEHDAGRLQLSSAEERQRHAGEQLQQIRDEIEKLDVQIQRTTEELDQTKSDREERDEQVAALEIRQIETREVLERVEHDYKEHQRKTTNAKIELAKSEDRLENLTDRIRQFKDHLQERQEMLAENQRRSKSLRERRDMAQLAILRIESALASLYLKKESSIRDAAEIYRARHDRAARRTKLQTEQKRLQNDLSKIRTKVHTKQIELERCTQQQKTLLQRLKEDYEIDLEELERTGRTPTDTPEGPTGEPADDDGAEADEPSPDDYRKEIDELRVKLQRLGGVNHEAIETLETLEARHTSYSNQYDDLLAARRGVEKIIDEIDAKTRRLFEETFEGVRHHFRELFQQLFGGGNADLVLEDPENVLESGVDIVAKPPGKELKSVMLLSGGEKTMTCVALLLAFFRYRPNPVCILDECDAALDEGNIDRFVNVIKEFHTNTQFLMITHSKKTMASATTIYGVTMQESGVSKPVSVRFAEVDENGNLIDGNPIEEAA